MRKKIVYAWAKVQGRDRHESLQAWLTLMLRVLQTKMHQQSMMIVWMAAFSERLWLITSKRKAWFLFTCFAREPARGEQKLALLRRIPFFRLSWKLKESGWIISKTRHMCWLYVLPSSIFPSMLRRLDNDQRAKILATTAQSLRKTSVNWYWLESQNNTHPNLTETQRNLPPANPW